MKKFLIQELSKVIKGEVITWNEGRKVKRFIKQPDMPLPDSLYFITEKIQGEMEDQLLNRLKKHDAAGIVIESISHLVIDKWKKKGIGVIKVKDRRDAYDSLAAFYRTQFDIPVIEVIGSSGKTTTKEMIGSVLREKVPALVGFYNYNAPAGVSYNILQLREYHKAAVLEVGMKGSGVMRYSSNIVKPTIGVLTCIHRAHFARLGSIEKIISAKAEILDCLDEEGILIINGEDENCNKFPLSRYKGKILKFGFSEEFDIWASDIKYKDFKTFFTAKGKDFEIDCVINTFGRYNVGNALAAIMVGIELGASTEEIQTGLASFKSVHRRLEIEKGVKNTTIINDNFNANPDSTKLLLDEIPFFTKEYPVILVLGDMENPDKKLEKYAREVHYKLGQQIASIDLHHFIAIGQWAEEYVKGAIDKGMNPAKIGYFKSADEAKNDLLSCIIPESVVLFKASQEYVELRTLIDTLKM